MLADGHISSLRYLWFLLTVALKIDQKYDCTSKIPPSNWIAVLLFLLCFICFKGDLALQLFRDGSLFIWRGRGAGVGKFSHAILFWSIFLYVFVFLQTLFSVAYRPKSHSHGTNKTGMLESKRSTEEKKNKGITILEDVCLVPERCPPAWWSCTSRKVAFLNCSSLLRSTVNNFTIFQKQLRSKWSSLLNLMFIDSTTASC